jgi:ABC-type multidrug transport system ATPase subunit
MTQSLITLDRIVCNFGAKEVLKELSLSICEGEVTAIVGSNGSGKSTLLKMISGYGRITQGSRKEAARLDKLSIGFAPDGFPRMRFTAAEYLRSMGRIRGMDKDKLEGRITELLFQFGLDPVLRQHLRHYSKGMLQKVNLMQALLGEPELLLLDEPLSGLDFRTQDELENLLLQLKEKGMAIVLSTHERELIERIADRVVILDNGVVENDYRISSKRSPENRKTITFDLAEDTARKCISQVPNLIVRSHENDRWSIDIDSTKSDGFLQVVLLAGASVVSVGIAHSDETQRRAPGVEEQGIAI